jgi:hypothetical protein
MSAEGVSIIQLSTALNIANISQPLILALALIFAKGQVSEARAIRKAQSQPYVIVSLEPDETSGHILIFSIANIGSTAARNIRLTIYPPLLSSYDEGEKKETDTWLALWKGIPTLVPGQKLRYFLDTAHMRSANPKLISSHEVTVSYQGDGPKNRQDYKYNYILDVGVWMGTKINTTKSLDDVCTSIDNINKSLEGLLKHFSKRP